MNRSHSLFLFHTLFALAAFAHPYTEGWLTADYQPVDTNAIMRVAQKTLKQNVFLRMVRHVLQGDFLPHHRRQALDWTIFCR